MTDATSRPDAPLPVLILIHGATLNGHMWDPVRRHLDPRLQIIAPDLPGHGSRRDEAYTLAGAVQTVAAVVHSLNGAPVVLIGDSLGGYSCTASAAALPAAQLKGLVLGGCTANLNSFRALLPFRARVLMFKALMAISDEDKLMAKSMTKVRKSLLEVAVLAEDIDALFKAGLSLKAYIQAVQALTGVDFRAKIAAITQPVLLVNGDKDPDMMVQEPSFVAAARHGSRHVFENCVHGVSLQRSEGFARLVNEFIARLN